MLERGEAPSARGPRKGKLLPKPVPDDHTLSLTVVSINSEPRRGCHTPLS